MGRGEHPAEQWLPLCAWIAKRTGRSQSVEDREDLTSELHIRLIFLLEEYDPARGIPLSRYLRQHLRFYAIHWWRNSAPRALGKNGRRDLEHPEGCTPLRHARVWARLAVLYPRSLEEIIHAEEGEQLDITLADTIPDPSPTPEEHALAAEAVEEAWERVAMLPREQAQIIALHFGEDRLWKDAAPLIGITARSAYRRWEQARAELRRAAP